MNSALRLRALPVRALLRRRCAAVTGSLRVVSAFQSGGASGTFTGRVVSNNSQRQFTSTSSLLKQDYPPHILFPMPALSPTMESGTINNWEKQEGDAFSAGDVICSIETDKATVDFEAQDDGFLAKILRSGPNMVDIAVGTPICVVVEEAEYVAAFADFVAEETGVDAPSEVPAPVAPVAAASPAGQNPLLPSARFLSESKYVKSCHLYG
jgi:hypothetical protein